MGKFTTIAQRGYIYVIYYHGGEKFQVTTGFQVSDPKNPIPNLRPSDPQFKPKTDKINQMLQDMFTANSRLRTANVYPDVHALRREYFKVTGVTPDDFGKPESHYKPFWDMFEEYLNTKRISRSPTTINNYNQFKSGLQEYCKMDQYDITFKGFEQVQFGRYIQFLTLKKKNLKDEDKTEINVFSESTINKHVRCLTAFYKWAYPELPRTHFSYEWKNVHNVHPLYEGELKYLIESEDVPEYLRRTRDLFVFCCCTGMRYSDSQNFKDYWVDNGVIAYNQIKTGGDAIAPLVNAANMVLVRYGATTPKIPNPVYNWQLKELFKILNIIRAVELYDSKTRRRTLVPFFEQVTTHTARKTFVTLALEKGIAVQDVMLMSGHHDFRAMRPYIKISREHLREQSKKLQW